MWVKDAKRNGGLKIHYEVGTDTKESTGVDSMG